jgi:hypothetical protein
VIAAPLEFAATTSPVASPTADNTGVLDAKSLRVIDEPSSPGLLESILGGVMRLFGF